MTTATVDTSTGRLKRLFMREDPVYDYYSTKYQAKTSMGKLVYLSLYLLPGYSRSLL